MVRSPWYDYDGGEMPRATALQRLRQAVPSCARGRYFLRPPSPGGVIRFRLELTGPAWRGPVVHTGSIRGGWLFRFDHGAGAGDYAWHWLNNRIV